MSFTNTITSAEFVHLLRDRKSLSGSISWQALQAGLTLRKFASGAVIPVEGRLVLGDPVGPAGTYQRALREMANSADNLAFLHIGHEVAVSLQEQGYHLLELGSESHVSLPFSLEGARKADLRRANNRARRAGVEVREIEPWEHESLAPEIRRLNRRWLQSRGTLRREFRFLARPLRDFPQPGERRFIATCDGKIVGLNAYDPIYQEGKLNGYLEAVTRRFNTSIPGMRDYLTLTAFEAFASEGVSWVSLGLAPFDPVTTSINSLEPLHIISRLALKSFYRFGSSLFNCRGLAFHKSRYRGQKHPVYLASKSPFPLWDFYLACRLSHLDPLRAIADFLISGASKSRRLRPANSLG